MLNNFELSCNLSKNRNGPFKGNDNESDENKNTKLRTGTTQVQFNFLQKPCQIDQRQVIKICYMPTNYIICLFGSKISTSRKTPPSSQNKHS